MPPQIAKAQGAHVTTTCSTRNVDFVTQQLGADAAIDYTQAGATLACLCRSVWARCLAARSCLKNCCRQVASKPGVVAPAAAAASVADTFLRLPPLACLPQAPWEEAAAAGGEGFDLLVDSIGGSYESASLRLLKPGGRLSALGATGPGVDHVSYWGMAALLFNAFKRTLLGRLRLAPKYTL